MSLRSQFFDALVILDTSTIEIRLLRRKFDLVWPRKVSQEGPPPFGSGR